MSKLSTKKQTVKGNIAALQTVLERYPVLLTTNDNVNETSLSFMLDILKIMGLTQEDILEWMAGILTNVKDGSSGLLSTIEIAVKTAILLSFKNTYTCSVNPTLPDDIMYSMYDEGQSSYPPARGMGVEIDLQTIDPFGLLNFCPVNKNESIFYFDTENYNPRTVYKSMDFNAYLWYIINRGNFRTSSERHKALWDNRNTYFKKFTQNGNETLRDTFFDYECKNQPTAVIRNIGVKKEFLACMLDEKYSNSEGNISSIRVFLNADRYYRTSILGKNKTIFEFNADYIYSLRLFDSKTLIAQLMNALIGIGTSTVFNLSIERRAFTKQINALVDRIIETEDTETIENDCFYNFSNEDYQNFLDAAELQYNEKYLSGNENGDLIDVDTDFIAEQIYKIEEADNLEERKTAIINSITSIANSISTTEETPEKDQYTFKVSIINKFIKEVVNQIALQALSPKIMLLYAINEEVMSRGEGEDYKKPASLAEFFSKFQNLIISIIKTINETILQMLYDFLIGQIKPIITLFIQKLLLETIFYYKILLESLMTECMKFGGVSGLGSLFGNRENLVIDNVVGADIVPVLKSPEEGCRTE